MPVFKFQYALKADKRIHLQPTLIFHLGEFFIVFL